MSAVSRYASPAGGPDRLEVSAGGRVLLDVPMGPGSPLHPRSAGEAHRRPWFYTGSPHGDEILALAKERGAL